MNALLWKRHIAKFYPVFSKKNVQRKIILIYHAIGDGPWAISTENFKKQIRWLKENTDIISLTELLTNSARKNTTQVALTFDDGYSCLYDVVLPILQAENATATIYINTGWMGESEKARKKSRPDLGHYPDESFLTWDEVKKLDQNSWEIGSHGVDHIDLTKYPDDKVQSELAQSKITIEGRLQKKCAHFAYTFGKHSKKVQRYVAQTGYHYAAAAHHVALGKNDNHIALPRLNIQNDYSLEDFKNIIIGKWDFLGTIQHIKRYL